MENSQLDEILASQFQNQIQIKIKIKLSFLAVY